MLSCGDRLQEGVRIGAPQIDPEVGANLGVQLALTAQLGGVAHPASDPLSSRQSLDAGALFGVEVLHTRSLRPYSRLSYATGPARALSSPLGTVALWVLHALFREHSFYEVG